jgi:ribosomal protein L24E
MNELRSRERHWKTGVLQRAGAGLAALLCTAAFAVGLTAPAGAVSSFGPHGSAVTPHVSASLRAHAVAPLDLANIVVTDLSTNVGTVYSWSNPAPYYHAGDNCNQGGPLCMTFGSGPHSANGGDLEVTSNHLQPGSTDLTSLDVNVDNTECLTGAGASAAMELDQYVTTSGQMPVQVVGVQFDCTNDSVDISGTIAYNIVPTDPQNGYYIFGQQGEIAGFGNDNYLDYLNGAFYYNLNAPIVAMAPTPDGGGYWMIGADGGVFSSGDAGFYGSTGNLVLNKPVVGMATTPDGKGYWFVASDGGIFAYGDAAFYGSRGGQPLNKPIVGMAATPDGRGYWLVASDGGIFSYGDAGFYGSTGSLHLNQPVVGMIPTPSGHGYWFVASDGGIFAYGDAGFYGSTGAIHLNAPIVGMAAAPDGNGYWFVASDGGVFNYGSAGFAGSLGGSGVDDVAGISLGI